MDGVLEFKQRVGPKLLARGRGWRLAVKADALYTEGEVSTRGGAAAGASLAAIGSFAVRVAACAVATDGGCEGAADEPVRIYSGRGGISRGGGADCGTPRG